MNLLSRRSFLHQISLTTGTVFASPLFGRSNINSKPNIILIMADDLGWGDTGFNGHPIIKTPNLDQMANEGIRFTRFYSASAVCSPTRGSCLTGRHPQRYGIFGANSGHVKDEEITLAEVLKEHGYTTGHFGKWHLGTLTTEIQESNRAKPGDDTHYSPPWENGFDECFSTEAKVPTWDPMITPEHWTQGAPGEPYGTHYWTGQGKRETENLMGSNSQVIMDRAVQFIENAANSETPFFSVIWFHTPHSPVVAGEKYRAMYSDQDENKQHYFGCITAMDEQIGRLRETLKSLNVDQNTMIWFCSDNGPAGVGGGTAQQKGKRQQGSSGPYRARKGSLYEGGVRVPGLLVWPDKIKEAQTNDFPCVTSDYFPTILDAINIQIPEQDTRPYDGISLMPAIKNKLQERSKPIAFEFRNQIALTDNRYKIYSPDNGKTFELYDLIEDPKEANDLSLQKPQILRNMVTTIKSWQKSCIASNQGADYIK